MVLTWLCGFWRKALKRNPIENRAISVFSGQKCGTKIILSISQSFLPFLKAKDINSCLP